MLRPLIATCMSLALALLATSAHAESFPDFLHAFEPTAVASGVSVRALFVPASVTGAALVNSTMPVPDASNVPPPVPRVNWRSVLLPAPT